ncbi:MAG: iron-siderophore ABC transporter substrate-binding protein [Cyanobacteria bacterium P01_F01_bin.153]
MLLFSILWGLGSCQRQPSPSQEAAITPDAPGNCRTIEHQQGTTEICGQLRNIVVLGPYLLEPVIALGEQPAGFGDHSLFHKGDYDNPSGQIPYLGSQITTQPVNVGLAYQPSIEAILKIKPDLILARNFNRNRYESLAAIAPTLSLDVVNGKTHLRTVAKALNRTKQAEQLIADTENRIESAKEKFAAIAVKHPKVLMMIANSTQSFSLIHHTQNLCGALVKDLGFNFVYPKSFKGIESNSRAVVLSQESLPQLNDANSIILLGYKWNTSTSAGMDAFERSQLEELKQAWTKNAIAQSLDASKAGRVYFIPAYLCLGLPGPIGTQLYLDTLEKQFLASDE